MVRKSLLTKVGVAVFSAAMLISTAASPLCTMNVHAAPADFNAVEYAIVNPDVAAVFGNDADALYRHYTQFGINEQRMTSVDQALKSGATIDINRLIVNYINQNKQFYLAHYMDPDFGFFNVTAYAAANPDVVAAFGNNPELILMHYLNCGALEGRSSQTLFDPIVAIVVSPASAVNSNNMVELAINFQATAGTLTTQGIEVAVADNGQVAISKVDPKAPAAAAVNPNSLGVFGGQQATLKPSTPAPAGGSSSGGSSGGSSESTSGGSSASKVYNYIQYNADLMVWNRKQPKEITYLSGDVLTAYEAWLDEKPELEDYMRIYADRTSAIAAFESNLTSWEQKRPYDEVYLATTTFAADFAEWEASEPHIEEYSVAYASVEDATADFNILLSVWQTYVKNCEGYSDFETAYKLENTEATDEDVFDAFLADEENADAIEALGEAPVLEDFTSKVFAGGIYSSEDDKNAKIEADIAAREEAYIAAMIAALGDKVAEYRGEEGNEGATDAEVVEALLDEISEEDINSFMEANPEIDENDYFVGYATVAAADSAFDADMSTWIEAEPDRDEFLTSAGYDAAVAEWEASEPKREDYIGNIVYFVGSEETEEADLEAELEYYNSLSEEEQTAYDELYGGAPDSDDNLLFGDTLKFYFNGKRAAINAFETDCATYTSAKAAWDADKAAYDEYLAAKALYEAYAEAAAEDDFDEETWLTDNDLEEVPTDPEEVANPGEAPEAPVFDSYEYQYTSRDQIQDVFEEDMAVYEQYLAKKDLYDGYQAVKDNDDQKATWLEENGLTEEEANALTSPSVITDPATRPEYTDAEVLYLSDSELKQDFDSDTDEWRSEWINSENMEEFENQLREGGYYDAFDEWMSSKPNLSHYAE